MGVWRGEGLGGRVGKEVEGGEGGGEGSVGEGEGRAGG